MKMTKSIANIINKKRDRDLTKERNARCEPVAKNILTYISQHPLKFNCKSQEELYKAYEPLASDIIRYMLTEEVRTGEVDFIFRLVLEAVENTKNLINLSFEKSFSKADEKRWGKPIEKVTLKDIDKLLRPDYYPEED